MFHRFQSHFNLLDCLQFTTEDFIFQVQIDQIVGIIRNIEHVRSVPY